MSEPGPTALLVEDDPQIRRFLRATLPAHGIRLLEAPTGADGLAQAATRTPEVVLLDLGLPDLEGLEFIKKLREWASGTGWSKRADLKIHVVRAPAWG